LTKREVVAAGKQIRIPNISALNLIGGHTSGTTGASLQIFYTRAFYKFLWALWWRHRNRFGIEVQHRHAHFGSKVMVPIRQTTPPFWRENPISHQTVFSQYHMKPENLSYYIDRLDKTKFEYYSGFPSLLYTIASHLKENNRRLKNPPKVVFTCSETLLGYQKKLIEGYIAKPTDGYGAAEGAGMASKCEHDYYHIDMELGILEVVPIPSITDNEGEITGRIVVTGFDNPAMPLVRYELNDIGTLIPNFKCPCGRNSPVLKSIDGRIESYLITADGRRIGRASSIFQDTEWIRCAQIIQDTPGRIKIKYVARRNPTRSDINFLLKQCKLRFLEQMDIELERVKDIPQEPNGKFRAIISTVSM
jgi:phenylacetate-CoA ligase